MFSTLRPLKSSLGMEFQVTGVVVSLWGVHNMVSKTGQHTSACKLTTNESASTRKQTSIYGLHLIDVANRTAF